MSDGEVPAAPRKRLGAGGVIGLVMALGVAGGIGAGFVPENKPEKVDYPAQWDPRVLEFVQYASNDRGLQFKHPVYVDFLSEAEFKKTVTSSKDDLSDKGKQAFADFEGQNRALGWISGKVDLFNEANQLSGAGILAYYSYGDHRIRIRGEKLTPAIQITLVHELTHVLQDQNFDIGATSERLGKSKTEDDSSFRAVVEGDARRIEHDFRGTLSKNELAEASKEEEATYKGYSSQVADVPEFMQALDESPYSLGNAIVTTAYASGGNKAIDALLEHPPVNDRWMLDPAEIGRTRSVPDLPPLALTAGQKEDRRNIFGTTELYLMLAKAMPPKQAFALAWSDFEDRYVSYTDDGKACIKAAFGTSSAERARALHGGLAAWAERVDTGAALTHAGDIVTMTACDPGKEYTAPVDHALAAMHVLEERNFAYADVRKDGGTPAQAACFANGILGFSDAALTRLDEDHGTAADQQQIYAIAARCHEAKA